MSNRFAHHWHLDPEIDFLNHGSFGACPRPVLAEQQRLRERMEQEPVQFFDKELPEALELARRDLAAFLRCDPADLVFVNNATQGVNTVLRSMSFAPGDELVVTDHEYNASRNAIDYVAHRGGARVVVVSIPFPLSDREVVLERVVSALTSRTRLVLIDHVTSQTGLIMPLEELARDLQARGIDLLVDGAHGPGMLDLDLGALDVPYYTGNCHKWICAPKGAGFLYVRRDRQANSRPLSISHGANAVLAENQSRFQAEFGWTGTDDPSPFLCVGPALRFMGSLLEGGWASLRAANRALVLEGRAMLTEALGIEAPAPLEMIGSLAAVPLPKIPPLDPPVAVGGDPWQRHLYEEFKIEVPVILWPTAGDRLLRISAQIYNESNQYERLARALRAWHIPS